MSALSAIRYVGPLADFATSRFGLPLVVAGGIVLFYEGVPIGPLRYIPYAGPALASLVDGRVDREFARGERAQEALWQERLRLAAIAQAADTKTRQQDIDAAVQEYIDKQDADAGRIEALQRAQKDEDNGPPDPAQPPACRPAGMSAGVSKRLDAIGR